MAPIPAKNLTQCLLYDDKQYIFDCGDAIKPPGDDAFVSEQLCTSGNAAKQGNI